MKKLPFPHYLPEDWSQANVADVSWLTERNWILNTKEDGKWREILFLTLESANIPIYRDTRATLSKGYYPYLTYRGDEYQVHDVHGRRSVSITEEHEKLYNFKIVGYNELMCALNMR